jgi:hypothetical protein
MFGTVGPKESEWVIRNSRREEENENALSVAAGTAMDMD